MNTIKLTGQGKYLVIEDSARRISWFRSKLPIANTVYATTPEAAVEAVSVAVLDYDVVFLDHDAVNIFWNEEDKDEAKSTFIYAARKLAMRGFSGTVIIHSFNEPGARRMDSLLWHTADTHIWKFGMFDIECDR